MTTQKSNKGKEIKRNNGEQYTRSLTIVIIASDAGDHSDQPPLFQARTLNWYRDIGRTRISTEVSDSRKDWAGIELNDIVEPSS